jgi:hypothetical protein
VVLLKGSRGVALETLIPLLQTALESNHLESNHAASQ